LHPGLLFSDLVPCEFAIVKGRLAARRGLLFRSLPRAFGALRVSNSCHTGIMNKAHVGLEHAVSHLG